VAAKHICGKGPLLNLPKPSALVFSLALWALPAHAQTAAAPPPETELGAVQEELQSSTAAQEKIKAEMAQAVKDQETISGQLITLAKSIQTHEAAVSASEQRLQKLRKEDVLICATLAEKQEKLSVLLAGLQRLEQNPPPPLVVEPHDVLAALRGAMMFGSIVPELRSQADALNQQLARLDRIRVNLESEKATLNANLVDLRSSQLDLGQLILQKKQLVFDHTGQLENEKQRAAALASKAQSLQQLLADLAAEHARQQAEKTKQALALEAERKHQEELLARPRMVFASARGQLEYPVQGQILKRFGDDDGLGAKLRGLAVATRSAAQIISPVDGKVEFAGSFRSYGQLLIVNAGDGYLVLLAGMRQISAEIGQTIRAGEPVGIMGDGPSSVTLLGDQIQEPRPVLYIEFRKNGEAIDSAPWWIGGLKEANK
jgi:septal ring factor EnvC (AmiA/AmiB activator)